MHTHILLFMAHCNIDRAGDGFRDGQIQIRIDDQFMSAACWFCFCLTLVSNRINRKGGISHPVTLGIGSLQSIRDCLDREAILSPLGSALGLQCL